MAETTMVVVVQPPITRPLNTHQLLQAYLEIGGFRSNSNPERNATDPCVMNAILSVLDK
jgi:hypothetical protein